MCTSIHNMDTNTKSLNTVHTHTYTRIHSHESFNRKQHDDFSNLHFCIYVLNTPIIFSSIDLFRVSSLHLLRTITAILKKAKEEKRTQSIFLDFSLRVCRLSINCTFLSRFIHVMPIIYPSIYYYFIFSNFRFRVVVFALWFFTQHTFDDFVQTHRPNRLCRCFPINRSEKKLLPFCVVFIFFLYELCCCPINYKIVFTHKLCALTKKIKYDIYMYKFNYVLNLC